MSLKEEFTLKLTLALSIYKIINLHYNCLPTCLSKAFKKENKNSIKEKAMRSIRREYRKIYLFLSSTTSLSFMSILVQRKNEETCRNTMTLQN